MLKATDNIILIGMPGAGKSTVGVLVAKELAMSFLDTDLTIQAIKGCTLQEMVDRDGYMALRCAEEEVLYNIHAHRHVISTGGSAVYSELAMNHLAANGTVVFLDVDLASLESRISNYSTRGLAKHPDQSFDELFQERLTLYRRYADIMIPCRGLNQQQVSERIIKALN